MQSPVGLIVLTGECSVTFEEFMITILFQEHQLATVTAAVVLLCSSLTHQVTQQTMRQAHGTCVALYPVVQRDATPRYVILIAMCCLLM